MILVLSLLACNPEPEPGPFDDLATSETRVLPGLRCSAEVIRTEGNVPHIYAVDRADLARVMGFTMARDRYFEMDLARRLGLGTVSELLGADALSTDMESRSSGMTQVADNILATLTDEQAEIFDAFAEGINQYIAAVKAGDLPPPSELELASGLLGASSPDALMAPFDRRGVAGVGATLVYELGYETGDVGRARTADALTLLTDDGPLGALRHAGAVSDIWARNAPVFAIQSAPGWGGASGPPGPVTRQPSPARVPTEVLDRLASRMDRVQRRLGHDWEEGFGSNAWAVTAAASGGPALMAGDGHLPLSVPSLFYQMGLDTSLFGGGDTHQLGLGIPGLPMLAVGTNGRVAWSQTQLMGDITDWYREELSLDQSGAPSATLFQGEQKPLLSFPETFVVANVPLLGSVGRTETWTRYTTFDGRWIADIEGRRVDPDEAVGSGETIVMLGGDFIVPADTDGDGVITAISFDYTGLDAGNVLLAVDRFGHADDVQGFQEASRGLVAYSQNMAVADANGSVLYTGYQAVPCRSYLARSATGWSAGADPSLLLDGTVYGGFTIPFADNVVDESFSSDPARCVVPFADYPQSVDPPEGYVLTANNDPAGISFDDDVSNDDWYIGGSWDGGWRADTIDRRLAELVARGDVTAQDMADVQADTHSRLGEQFAEVLLDAIAHAKVAEGDPGSAEGRLAALYRADSARFDEVETRLSAWVDADYPTPSGVKTFYNDPSAEDLEMSVATMVFNAWFPRFLSDVFDDEGLPDVWEPTGSTGRVRALTLVVEGRGPNNPMGLASYNPDTEESAFFDIYSTEPIESSDEVALMALGAALDYLESSDGFETPEMDDWIWGLKHTVHFDSILGDFLGSEGAYAPLVEQFSIDADVLPIDEGISVGDPRYGLPGYPRQGDQFSVDAANPGFSGTNFTYGSGPVFRMVVALDGDGVSGLNILPGGQAALTDSEFFADQAALWLANEAFPLRFAAEDVVAGAIGRERFLPGGSDGRCP